MPDIQIYENLKNEHTVPSTGSGVGAWDRAVCPREGLGLTVGSRASPYREAEELCRKCGEDGHVQGKEHAILPSSCPFLPL